MQERIVTDILFFMSFHDLGLLYKQIGRGLISILIQKQPDIGKGRLRHRQRSALWIMRPFLPSLLQPEMQLPG